MSIRTVVTRGYSSGGLTRLVVVRGYGPELVSSISSGPWVWFWYIRR